MCEHAPGALILSRAVGVSLTDDRSSGPAGEGSTSVPVRPITHRMTNRLWGAGNPGFFKRTVVEKAAGLAETPGRAPASPVA